MPTNRLRGRVRPGSRTSAAKLVIVSRPVYASVASDSARAIDPHEGVVPMSTPMVSESDDQTRMNPRIASSRLATRATPAMTTAMT